MNEIEAVFAGEKPGHLDGRKRLSFQFFDRSGYPAFKVFMGFGARILPKRRRSSGRCGKSSEKSGGQGQCHEH
jgi:hypothetical protein